MTAHNQPPNKLQGGKTKQPGNLHTAVSIKAEVCLQEMCRMTMEKLAIQAAPWALHRNTHGV